MLGEIRAMQSQNVIFYAESTRGFEDFKEVFLVPESQFKLISLSLS